MLKTDIPKLFDEILQEKNMTKGDLTRAANMLIGDTLNACNRTMLTKESVKLFEVLGYDVKIKVRLKQHYGEN